MTLTDTGPIVALLDIGDKHHKSCLIAAGSLDPGSMATTWPCFTEAMYLLGAVGGFRYQERLWSARSTGRIVILDLSSEDADRMDALMRKYSDSPMDLADASLAAIAESHGFRRIFTIDSHFHAYRLNNDTSIEVVP